MHPQIRYCPFSVALLFVFAFWVGALPATALVILPPNVTVPAVLVFGDSIVDAGNNNNNMLTMARSNYPPYGRDFIGGIPTGRFSNGKLPNDLIAEQLAIKDTIPAYLDPTIQIPDLLTGVTFASGGAGWDPLTAQMAQAMTMSDQLALLKEYIGKLRVLVGEEKTNFILANSLFLIVSGSDDIANNYFTLRVRQLQYDVNQYTSFMVQYASDFMKELYDLGGRRIGVFSAPPIGCVPSQRTVAGGVLRECAESYNQAAQLFNAKLASALKSFNRRLPRSKMVYIDIYNPLLDLIQHPEKHGFRVADRGCCGTGLIEVTMLCTVHTPGTCANASDFVFWDSYHPTERAYRELIDPLLNRYVNQFF